MEADLTKMGHYAEVLYNQHSAVKKTELRHVFRTK